MSRFPLITIEKMCRMAPELFSVGCKAHVSEHASVKFIKNIEQGALNKCAQLLKK